MLCEDTLSRKGTIKDLKLEYPSWESAPPFFNLLRVLFALLAEGGIIVVQGSFKDEGPIDERPSHRSHLYRMHIISLKGDQTRFISYLRS